MRFLLNLSVLGLTGIMFGGLAALMIISYYAKDLPNYDALEQYSPPHVTRFYTANGKILGEYATEKRMFVPITAIPKRLQQAFIAAEDQNFYAHPGVDFVGIARAMSTNIANLGSGRSLVGGSTITQQVVKNFLLTREQSFERKIKEAILAFRITNSFSKDKILELYLNEIYLGRGSYGVAAAALDYFNRSIDDLSIEETALLAALPKAPSRFDPHRNYERTKERRDWVIGRMLEDGYITADEARRAQEMPILLRDRDEEEMEDAPHYAEEVRREIMEMYGADMLYKGGLTVHTAMEPKYQRIAYKALIEGLMAYERRHGYRGPLAKLENTKDWQTQLSAVNKPTGAEIWRLAVVLGVSAEKASIGLNDGSKGVLLLEDVKWARRYSAKDGWGPSVDSVKKVMKRGDVILVVKPPKDEQTDDKPKNRYYLRQVPDVDGAVVVMDPHTGRVLAMVGGAGFKNQEFNRATQAYRQPGSAFKPFVYLTALENGFTPSTVLLDAPIELYQGAGLPMWRPQNYSNKFYGPTTLRVGLEKSQNVLTIRLAQRLGLQRINETAMRFGVYDEPTRNYSSVLGSVETTLMRLVTSYAMLVNGGKRVQPVLIDRIQDRTGKIVFASDSRECPGCQYDAATDTISQEVPMLRDIREMVTDPLTAYQMVNIMTGVVERGTSVKAQAIGKPVAGKTGTTNDSIDSWFVGYTPDLVVGVFTGFDRPRTLGRKETGSSVALPIFVDTMKQALAGEPSTPFRIPPGIRLVKVDRTNGQRPNYATNKKDIIFEAFKPVVPVTEAASAPALSIEEGAVSDTGQQRSTTEQARPGSPYGIRPEPSQGSSSRYGRFESRYQDRYEQPKRATPAGYGRPGSDGAPALQRPADGYAPRRTGDSKTLGTGGIY